MHMGYACGRLQFTHQPRGLIRILHLCILSVYFQFLNDEFTMNFTDNFTNNLAHAQNKVYQAAIFRFEGGLESRLESHPA